MQETHDSSFPKQLTLEQLLQLKRLEKPGQQFWAFFERELQQKQLKALVKPTSLQRAKAFLLPRATILAPVAAAAAFAVFALLSMPFPDAGADLPLSGVHALQSDVAEPEAGGPAAEVETTRRAGAEFVMDALVPEMGPLKPFRTVAVPETFLAASDSSSYYVVNDFTAGGITDAVLEF